MEDARIVELFWARREEAIGHTQQKYGRACYALSLRILSSPMDAQECVSDALLRAWNAIPPDKPRFLGAWLMKIVRRLSLDRLDYLHAAKRNRSMEVLLEELQECIPTGDPTQESLEQRELTQLIESYLRTLEARDRSMFLRRYFSGESVQAIAAAFALRPNTVSQRLHRIRAGLRERLEKEGYLS